MNNYIVGIDIGASKICGVVGNLDSAGKLQVLGVTTSKCNGVRKSGVSDFENTSNAIKDVVTQLGNIINTNIHGVYISIPVSLCGVIEKREILTLSSQDREITSEDIENLKELIRLEVKQSTNKEVIKINLLEFKINDVGNINNPLGLLGKNLEVVSQVIVASKEIVDLYKKPVEDIGIKVLGFTVDCLGVCKDTLSETDVQDGVAIIDIGAETSDVVIYIKNKLEYVASIGLGGDTITNDIAICLKISKDDAESLKIKSGRIYKENIDIGEKIKIYSLKDGQTIEIDYVMLVEIIYERVKEIIKLIKEVLVDSGYYNQIKTVVLCGGGVSLYRGITDLIEKVVEKECRVVTPSYVGVANPIYTIATGIIKELSLQLNNDIEKEADNKVVIQKDEQLKKNKDDIKFLSKFKAFLSDFF
ncbi:cell division protein FtsA [Clostridium sp. CTA-19]